MPNKIKVIIKHPCKAAEVTVIDNSLSTIEKVVGGDIDFCSPTGIRGVGCYVHDNGYLIGLCPNILVLDAQGRWRYTLVGSAVFSGLSGGSLVSLTDKQIAKVLKWIKAHALIKTN